MFGRLNVISIVGLRRTHNKTRDSADEAVAPLLDLTEHPKIEKWVQFPKALFVFLVVPGDPESGAFYLYDRRAQVWYWIDFDDEKFGGYSIRDFDCLVRDCRFLDLVEEPRRITGSERWIVTAGSRPQRTHHVAERVPSPLEQ